MSSDAITRACNNQLAKKIYLLPTSPLCIEVVILNLPFPMVIHAKFAGEE
jgi:hypothetical protein